MFCGTIVINHVMFDHLSFQDFVRHGKVHIVPIPSNPGELTIYPTGTPTVLQALQLVFSHHKTEAGPKIQSEIKQRIDR